MSGVVGLPAIPGANRQYQRQSRIQCKRGRGYPKVIFIYCF